MKSVLTVFGTFLLVQSVLSTPGYDPSYYLHFPPIPYNHINFNGPPPPQFPPWIQPNQIQVGQTPIQNQTNRNYDIPRPTVRTLRVYPSAVRAQQPPAGNQPSQMLHNGTLLYYVSGPWGGIKSIPVNRNIDNTITTTPPNWSSIPSIPQPSEFAYFDRQQQNQQRQQEQQPQQVQNSSPDPNEDAWNQVNFGWGGWGPSYYDDPSVTTQNPTIGSTTPASRDQSSTTEGGKMTSTSTSTSTTTQGTSTASAGREGTTTVPIPTSSSDTLAKFRQIVTRIREITRQELKS